MSIEASSDLSSTERSERRARWEAFEFRVPAPGAMRVENGSYGDESSEHVYVVTVANGAAVECTCPADEYQPGAGKHRLAVEYQPGAGKHRLAVEYQPGAGKHRLAVENQPAVILAAGSEGR